MARLARYHRCFNRGQLLATTGAGATGAGLSRPALAGPLSPNASPAADEWPFTDVAGSTVTISERPARIGAYISNAASL